MQHAYRFTSTLHSQNHKSLVKAQAKEFLAAGMKIFCQLCRDAFGLPYCCTAGFLETLLHFFPPVNSFRYLHTSWLCVLRCCSVTYFSDLVVPLSCVKVQRYSATEMDSAINLPHQSPQTHSLCHRYPAADASFPPFPGEH